MDAREQVRDKAAEKRWGYYRTWSNHAIALRIEACEWIVKAVRRELQDHERELAYVKRLQEERRNEEAGQTRGAST